MTRYLAIPGCLLLIAAFVRATVTFEWDALNFGLAGAGVAVVVLTAAFHWREVVAWFRDPRGLFALTTAISVAVFVAVLVMVNIGVWYSPWSRDLTALGRNQVSDETIALLGRVDTPVSLRQFGRANADARVEQVLQTFARQSPLIRVEFADVDRERAQTTLYGVVKLGTVVVVAGEKFRKVEEPHEQALVTAILQVTADEERIACFAAGHGERALDDSGATGLAGLRVILEAANYRAQPITLDSAIPPECHAVVIAGARRPYSGQEMAQLTAYTATRPGRLAILLDPDPAPAFVEWLRARGIDPLAGTIVETGGRQAVAGGPFTIVAAAYPDHPSTRDFNYGAVFEGVRPIDVIQPAVGGRPGPLAQSSRTTFATVVDGATVFDETRDRRGPLNLAAATSIGAVVRPAEEVRLAVFGDSDFIANEFIGRGGGANRDLFLRTLAWLLGEQEATIVAVDPRDNRRTELSGPTRAWMYLVNLALLPLIPLIAGIVVYLRSRR